MRVHIWHPCLVKAGFDHTNGAAHDHRFGFSSTVLHGSLYNERITLTPHAVGDWHTYRVEHARAAKERTGSFDGACTMTNERFSAVRNGEWIHAGAHYEMAPREFHYSKAADLCVTVVSKTAHIDGSALILCRYDRELIHAFDGTERVPLELMQQAHEVLTGVFT